MSFNLITTRATYKIMVNKHFADMLGKNMEAYVDDMLVKSVKVEFHTVDIKESA